MARNAAAAKLLQSCPTLHDPIDGLLPGSSVPGILQARTLEWVAISFSHAWKWKVKVKSLSRVWLLATPWTAAYQAPPCMGFSRQEYWSGVPLPSPTTSDVLNSSVFVSPVLSISIKSPGLILMLLHLLVPVIFIPNGPLSLLTNDNSKCFKILFFTIIPILHFSLSLLQQLLTGILTLVWAQSSLCCCCC